MNVPIYTELTKRMLDDSIHQSGVNQLNII